MKRKMNDIFDNFNFFFDDLNTAKSYEVKNEEDHVFLNIIYPGSSKERFSVHIVERNVLVSLPNGDNKEFKLPNSVSTTDVTAEYIAGILKIRFNKKETMKRRIEIK